MKAVSVQILYPQEKKFFKDKTFIVDICNEQKNEMMTNLRSISHHLMKKTEINLHILSEKEDIKNYFSGSDIWEFRTKTFNYPDGELGKLKFKQMIERKLEDKSTIIKKIKI